MNDTYIVKLFKMTTGEEFMARILEDATDSNSWMLTIENPSVLEVDPNDSEKLRFAPWLPMAINSEYAIDSEHVMILADVHPEAAAGHKATFGPVIEVAPTPLILVP